LFGLEHIETVYDMSISFSAYNLDETSLALSTGKHLGELIERANFMFCYRNSLYI